MSTRKVFVLGLDGATFDVIRPMVAEGSLPAFARLVREGAWGPLESVPNQRSAAAWTSFQTGTNPGKHGVYEFFDYLPETHSLKFIHGAARDGESLWSILSRKGKRVCVINVPMTYPAEEVNGCLIAGLDCPSPRSRGFTWPRTLAKDLARRFGDYMIEPGLTGAVLGGRVDDAVDLVRRELEQKMAVARWLMQSGSWDFFMLVLRSLDAVQHVFWKHYDRSHPDHRPAEAAKYGQVIPNTYEMIDAYVGELLDTLDNDTSLVIMSDHGFGSKHPATSQLNAWLASKGLLAFSAAQPKAGAGLLGGAYRLAVGLTSRRTKEWLWRTFPRLRDAVQSRLCFTNINWPETKAYSDTLFPNIRINLRGRERNGIVPPGDECEQLVKRLILDLRALKDSRSGERIVDKVFRREEIYKGKYVEKAPELLVRWREDTKISGIAIEGGGGAAPGGAAVPGEDHRVVSGDHRLQGIFLAHGADLKQGQEVSGAAITDLAPTLLCLMGLPIPREMDGKVLTGIFSPDSLQEHPCVVEDGNGSKGPTGGSSYSQDEEAQIHQRLKDLGYVE